jgi:hypothetical protein
VKVANWIFNAYQGINLTGTCTGLPKIWGPVVPKTVCQSDRFLEICRSVYFLSHQCTILAVSTEGF